MDIKDYINNDIGIEIPKNNGTSKIVYPSKARKCFSTKKGYGGRIIKKYCVLYDESIKKCDGGFNCVNGIPQEKCYKLIAPNGAKSLEISEVWAYHILTKIIKLRENESKRIN